MKLQYSKIKKLIFIVLASSCLVFCIGWLKWYWTLATAVALFAGVFYGCFSKLNEKENRDEHTVEISKKTLVVLMVISVVWVWLSGIGGFWAQSEDLIYRNAIFRDIILRDWPVKYEVTGHALVYYIGFWLVPALFGKLGLLFGASDEAAFNIGNAALFVWTAFCIFLVFLLIIYTIKAGTRKKQIFAVVLFVFFSGMDIIGKIGLIRLSNYHLEWWAHFYQYSSFTTCLFWVFNQAIPAWLCFLCLANEKSMKNYIFLGMICLFNSPLPFVGFFIYAVAMGAVRLVKLIKEKKLNQGIWEVLSLSNIASAALLFPVFATYLLSNFAIQGAGSFQISEKAVVEGASDFTKGGDINLVYNYFSFICIEFLFLMVCVFLKYKKDALFYVTFVSLLVFPILKIGGGADFAMRASIPSLVMLYLYVARYLIEEWTRRKQKKSVEKMLTVMLAVLLCVGAFTPGMEIFRGCRQVCMNGIRTEAEDNVYTLGCDGPYDVPGEIKTYGNFVAVEPENQTFFKVFGR